MCTAVITTWLANESKMGVLYLAKQSSLLVVSFLSMTRTLSSLVGTQVGKEAAEGTPPRGKTSRVSKSGHMASFSRFL